ncbi:hypothetical protein CAPTEDRAFT_106886 [Capitella teleta]|uniref:Amine oxidase n=1 Tax=Capitella teleta TaxID=283909 RepID=R7TN58_CAPTE|nr:hypothetical protein CAPTEDRAFT_106886 [Capitella teleta]|eukprot:ELT94962.1 hypothetical protein CAPTEDRAFT_106886 [Capitella teleta]
MTTKTHDVIVIGAGISGLSSAKLMHEAGLEVIVLEARNRVGGRTLTKRDPSYNYVDVGGSYVGPTQDRILRLSAELGIKTYKVHTGGDYLHYSRGKITRFTGTWPKFRKPFTWLDINNAFRCMDQMIKEIPVSAPWDCPRAEEWDHVTVQQWIDDVCWMIDCKEYVRSFVVAFVAMEPEEISLLWFLWYIRSCESSRRIAQVGNGGQERKFHGGSMQICEGIHRILKDHVKLEHPVSQIKDNGQLVTVTCHDGTTFTSKLVVVAVAPSLYQKIHFEPCLPPLRSQLIQRVPMGSCIKNQVWYERAFWRQRDLNGWSSAADGMTLIGSTVDDCNPDASHPGITGFIMADRARDVCEWTPTERCKATCEYYAKLFGTDEALNPVGYEEFNWMNEEYSGGCYTSTYPPGVMTRFGKDLRKPLGRLRFAGTELATKWAGHMDGAVEAGERAAREVLSALGKIPESKIWQDESEFEGCPGFSFEISVTERAAPSIGGALKCMTFTGVLVVATIIIYKRFGLIIW